MYHASPPCPIPCDARLVRQCKELDFQAGTLGGTLGGSVAGSNPSSQENNQVGRPGRPMLDDVTLATGDPAMLASATGQRLRKKRRGSRDTFNAGCRGFVYVMDDGALLPVPCASFDARLVSVTDDSNYGTRRLSICFSFIFYFIFFVFFFLLSTFSTVGKLVFDLL